MHKLSRAKTSWDFDESATPAVNGRAKPMSVLRRLLRAAAIAVAALLLLLALTAGASRAIWGRSLQATVYERMLARRNATDRTADAEIARLEALREAGEREQALPEGLRLSVDIRRDAGNGMAYYVLNGDAGAATTVFYLHGGAYIHGFNRYQWRFMDALAREAGAEIVAPDYHLAPFGDCLRAYGDVTVLYRSYLEARPGQRMILMGDSAGGGLALGLAEEFVRQGLPLPERLILFSPWVDVTMENPDIAGYVAVEPILHLELVKVHGRYWAGRLDPHDPRVSPLFGDMAGLPPVTFYTGTRELLYPDSRLLEDALRAAGVAVDCRVGRGLNHDYPLMPIPEGRRAVREIVALCERADG